MTFLTGCLVKDIVTDYHIFVKTFVLMSLPGCPVKDVITPNRQKEETYMSDLSMLTGAFPVSADQLAHDLTISRLIKSGDVPAFASGFTLLWRLHQIFKGI